jgi:hypothetical protein
MAFVPREIFLVNQKVMVGIQFPETAVQHIEMLVGEVLSDFINVFFVGHLPQYFL